MAETQATQTKEQVAEKQLYELYVMVASGTGEAELETLRQATMDALEKHKAVVQRAEQFTKEELAQPIKKSVSAYVSTTEFWADPTQIGGMQDDLRLIEGNILRWMITKEEPKKEREEKPARTRRAPKAVEKKDEAKKETESTAKGEDEVTLEDIDRKLDEIMGTL